MNIDEIKQRVADIAAAAAESDDEVAHGMEDDLMEKFIQCIADGDYDPDMLCCMAQEVLKTSDIDFSRWCA